MKKLIFTIVVLSAIALSSISTSAAILPPAPTKTETKIKEAVNEFNSLSKNDKKERISKVKAAVQQYKANLKNGERIDDNKLLAIIFAILIPPVGVVLYENKVTTKFWISLLLTFIFWLPGMIYSLLVVTDNA
ncbi:MAG: hypothetical protein RLZZ204_742 [Bacteroidota bacterium]|jgi:uncharacterized membrane protein YqaE (UPF0057 family)